jgi:DHA1 family bicyclomycin/chloramphenicol resistance-like MFS transporter
LLIGRIVQAIGGASGLVASRAMAGDRAGAHATRDVALLMAVAMLSPMLAPVLGGYLSAALGWHAIFALLAAAGLAIGGCAFVWLPETRPVGGAVLTVRSLARDWRRLITDRRFLRNLLIGCSLTAGLYTFLTTSPFLLVRLGVPQRDLGLCFAAIAGALAAGALSASWLAGRLETRRIVTTAAGSIAAVAATFALLTLVAHPGAATLLIAMAIYAFGGGLIAPSAMSGAMAAGDGRAGVAVSAYGAIQMASNAMAAGAAAALPSGSPSAFALALAATAIVAALLAATKA